MTPDDLLEPYEDEARLEVICGLAADAIALYARDPSPTNWRGLIRLHRLLMLARVGPERGLRSPEHGE